MHYNGHFFRFIPAPSMGKAAALFSVMAIKPDDVWAVGGYFLHRVGYMTLQYESTEKLLIEHWNGHNWNIASVYNPGHGKWSGGVNVLSFVSANSPTDVWAVGHYYNGFTSRSLALKFNGNSWSIVKIPSIGRGINALEGIMPITKNNVWAVGTYTFGNLRKSLVFHFNGYRWIKILSANQVRMNNLLFGIYGNLFNGIWTAGTYYNKRSKDGGALVERFNGKKFKRLYIRKIGLNNYRNILYGITIFRKKLFVAGEYYNKKIHRALMENASLKHCEPIQP